jgi:hypothetical protein
MISSQKSPFSAACSTTVIGARSKHLGEQMPAAPISAAIPLPDRFSSLIGNKNAVRDLYLSV